MDPLASLTSLLPALPAEGVVGEVRPTGDPALNAEAFRAALSAALQGTSEGAPRTTLGEAEATQALAELFDSDRPDDELVAAMAALLPLWQAPIDAPIAPTVGSRNGVAAATPIGSAPADPSIPAASTLGQLASPLLGPTPAARLAPSLVTDPIGSAATAAAGSTVQLPHLAGMTTATEGNVDPTVAALGQPSVTPTATRPTMPAGQDAKSANTANAVTVDSAATISVEASARAAAAIVAEQPLELRSVEGRIGRDEATTGTASGLAAGHTPAPFAGDGSSDAWLGQDGQPQARWSGPATESGRGRAVESIESAAGTVDARGLFRARPTAEQIRVDGGAPDVLNLFPSFGPFGPANVGSAELLWAPVEVSGSMVDQIAWATELASQGPEQAVRLVLQPEGLGTVAIRVAVRESGVGVQIGVENAATRDMVQASWPQLQQALDQKGLSVQALLVDVFTGQAGSQGFRHDTQRQPIPLFSNTRRPEPLTIESVSDTLGNDALHRVDYRV